jgi:dynein heavy chain
MIESKLEKKRGKKCIGANGSKQCLIFVDDINMPMVEPNGAQPPIELLRQLIDSGFIYDRPKYFKKIIENYRFLCAAAPPAGRAQLTPRFMRHFHIVNIPNANEEILTHIFKTMISEFMIMNKFAQDVCKCCDSAVAATIELFMQINKKLLPIPSKFHYLFNLRDISKVCQGILMSRAHSITTTDDFAKLWVHECQRVFMDRLNTQADRDYFKELALDLMCFRFKG